MHRRDGAARCSTRSGSPRTTRRSTSCAVAARASSSARATTPTQNAAVRLRPRRPVGAQRREVRAACGGSGARKGHVVGDASARRSSDATTQPRPSSGPIRVWHGSATSTAVDRAGRALGRPALLARTAPPVGDLRRPRRGTTASGRSCTATTRPTRSSAPDSSGSSSPTRHRRRSPVRAGVRGVPALAGCRAQPPALLDAGGVPRDSSALIGSPAEVVDKIGRYQEAFGHELSGVSLDVPGLPESVTRRSVERFFADVAPVVRREHPSRQEFRHALNA